MSIDPAVPQSRLVTHLAPSDASVLRAHFKERPVPAWGFTPTKTGGQSQLWASLERGARALFTGDGGAFAMARLAHKAHSVSFARSMWGDIEDGRTWEYLVFLDDVVRLTPTIPYSALNARLGYQSNYVFPGAVLLTPERVRALEALLDERGYASAPAWSTTITSAESPPGTGADPRDLFQEVASLDAPSAGQRRVEQHALRRLKLNGRKSAPCAICGGEFSDDLLVAAHIKRRADCSHEERLNFADNVMLLCAFGCDALFERQYLTVSNGRIHEGPRKASASSVRAKVTYLIGKPCAHWTETSRKFFDAHRVRGIRASDEDNDA